MVEGSRGIRALLATCELNNDSVILGIAKKFARRLAEGEDLTIVGESVALSTLDNLTAIDGDFSDLCIRGQWVVTG